MECKADGLNWLFLSVIRKHHHLAQTLLSELGLFRGQPPVLFVLWEKDGLTQTELSEKLGIRPATMTTILKRMEKSGFVERKPDLKDLRKSRVYLTKKGWYVKEPVEKALRKIEDESFGCFSPQEKMQFENFLARMKESLDKAIDNLIAN
ncbi:MAG: MarR family transcriptional regulator [Firmicutes bacterium]|nr:MarR family transcriptional regulator [Bacillota bacterium]